MKFTSRMKSARKALGWPALLLSVLTLSSCGGGSGTNNDAGVLPTCRDPLVLLDNGVCGEPRPPYELPACPEGTIRAGANCIVPDFPAPERLAGPGEAVIYVNIEGTEDEKNAAFASYNLHIWQACGNGWGDSVTDGTGATWSIPTTWPAGPGIASKNSGPEGVRHDPYYGAYFVIPVSETGTCGNYIIKTPGGAAQTADLTLSIKHDGADYERMAWVIVNTQNMRNSRVSNVPICINDVCTLDRPLLTIADVEAHWISPYTILWNRSFDADKSLELYQSAAGGMSPAADGSLTGGESLATLSAGRQLTDEEKALVPHLSDYTAYDLPETLSIDTIKAALKNELLIVGRTATMEVVGEGEEAKEVEVIRGRATRIQVAHVLDALYADKAADAKLGVNYENGITASVWAPTAQNVELRIFSGEPLRVAATKPMTFDAETGVWSVTGTAAEFDRKFYRYRVTAYHPVQKVIRRLEVTDPYSVSLSTNGRHSQFVNLDDADTKPAGWDGHFVPEVVAPENMVIYEAHVRDFSIEDASTPANYRGKYMAFTESNSAAVRHLKSLADAGLTHVHLLPLNDSSTVKEDFGGQINLDSYVLELCQRISNSDAVSVCDGSIPNNITVRQVLESYDPLTSAARDLIKVIEGYDGFNWGYDPHHFNAPEGSYSTNPEGFTRVKEMRAMNMALHELGLRVVMDVVYPHTLASGITAADSVFDKVVPGYYYRLNTATGEAENGTGAGADTATEHRMVAKFVTDSLTQWASAYKVDSFRFDQSGYMPKSVLVNAYEAVKAIDPDTYFYAEAWPPLAGTSGDRIAVRAIQEDLAGTGIGTFNDRMRDPLQQMKLIKGEGADEIRAGLAGNLKDFKLKLKSGSVINASSVRAYNVDPQEAINYVEKHDNETLWDWMHRPEALPEDMSIADRVRVSSLTLSIPVLSQGVPFVQMGTELLRSKSMSGDSYNAGDWFNKVDFTKQSNNWAVGLPPKPHSSVTDDYLKNLFANPETKPEPAHIEQASTVFTEFMQIAKGSPLFSLQTAEEVYDRLGFHDGGKAQVPGLIVMSIDDGQGTVAGTESTPRADLDLAVDAIVVVINGTATSQSPKILTASGFTLHQVQQNSVDQVVKTSSFEVDGEYGVFTVPAYTTAVFVKKQNGSQGEGLSATVTLDQSDQEPPPYEKDLYVRGSVYNEWGADSGNALTYLGNGIYSVVLELEDKNYEFKIATGDWSSPEFGQGSDAVALGSSAGLQQGGGNISITIPEAGKYRFELDASADKTTPVLKVFPDPMKGVDVYIRGVTSWDAVINNQLIYEGNGIYALDVTVASAGDKEFKVASADWETVNLGSSESLTVNSALVLTPGSNDNIKVNFALAGTYRFELNMQDPAAPTVKVFVPEIYSVDIFVRGAFNDWGTGNRLTYQGDGTYVTDVTFTATGQYQFKVASEDWSTVDRGIAPANPVVAINTPTVLQVGGGDTDSVNAEVKIDSEGVYTFELNAHNAAEPILTIKPKQ